MKLGIRAAANKELPQDHIPFDFSLLPDDKDESIISGSVFKGWGGFFTCDISGEVKEVDLAGQLFSRASTISE